MFLNHTTILVKIWVLINEPKKNEPNKTKKGHHNKANLNKIL
jgi:ubiquitin-protein ligase